MLRPWNLKLELNKSSSQAIYLQISQKIIEEIQTGRLPPSTAMPGTRELAASLNVNRKTTVLAYEELIAQGWLVTEKRRGTFVAENLAALPDIKGLNPVGDGLTEAVIVESSAATEAADDHHKRTAWIDFTEGTSDNRLLPLETFSRAFRKALLLVTRSSSQVNNPQGNLALRSSIAAMVNMEKNFHVDAGKVCVVSSSQMAAFIVARVLVRPGDCVVFESLSHPLVRQAFESCGANMQYVNIDASGADISQIGSLASAQKIRVVYVTPQHQFPTTVMMTVERRKELLRLAEQHDFYIIEDDREHEFYFDQTLPFPIASADRSDRTIYLGSLSSVLSPASQVAYLIAEKSLIERCVIEKNMIDCKNNLSLEHAVYELIESGEMQRHRRRIGKIFSERRQFMQGIIRDELGEYVDFELPKGGLAFWLRFRRQVDMTNFVKLGLEEKVTFAQGSNFCPFNKNIQAIRLGFASLNQKELESGIKRIKRALMASLMTMIFMVTEPVLHV